MNVSAIKDLNYEWYLKILSKLDEPLGECNVKEFSKYHELCKSLIARAFKRLLICYMKIANAGALICTAVQIEN